MENTTDFWKKHVAAIGQEGVAVIVYARRFGLSLASLYYWRQKLLAVDGNAGPSAHGKFVAMRIAKAPPPSGACILIFPSGLRFEMPVLPAAWLAALEQSHAGAR